MIVAALLVYASYLQYVNYTKPMPRITPGPDTTVVTNPVDNAGYIDYSAALNERFGKGVVPERNLLVLLLKINGPIRGRQPIPGEYFEKLHMPELTKDEEHFIDFYPFWTKHAKVDQAQSNEMIDQEILGSNWPWNSKQYPVLAAWLKHVEKPLKRLEAIEQQSDYFDPIITKPNKWGFASLPGSSDNQQMVRAISKSLTTRAMLLIDEGRFVDAWGDVLTCYRIARLVSRGPTMYDAMVSCAIESNAMQATLVLLDRDRASSEHILKRWKQIQNLPVRSSIDAVFDIYERYVFLDQVQTIHRGYPGMYLCDDILSMMEPFEARELRALAHVDFDAILRDGNRAVDRIVTLTRNPDRREQKKQLRAFDAEYSSRHGADYRSRWFEDTRDENFQAEFRRQFLKGRIAANEAVRNRIGRAICGLTITGVEKMTDMLDREQQKLNNLEIAFALVAYHKDQKKYPATLMELVPKYIGKIPPDLFNNQEPKYRVEAGGYLLYSVGINEADESGRTGADNPKGDDLVIRMPVPEYKLFSQSPKH